MCGNLILPAAIDYVYFYMKLNLRNLFYVILKDGTHGTHSDVDDGPLLLSAKNIKDGTIKWDETDRRIPQEEYEKIHSNFSLKTGDILLTIVGSIGETSILKDSEGLTFQRSVAFLRPKEDILSEFLYTEIQTPTFQKELESRKKPLSLMAYSVNGWIQVNEVVVFFHCVLLTMLLLQLRVDETCKWRLLRGDSLEIRFIWYRYRLKY